MATPYRLIDDYDAVVVGGGPGGIGASVASARNGARTLLIEREGCLGGAGTVMMVNPFMPVLTSVGPDGEPRKLANAGIFMEVLERLKARSGKGLQDWGGAEFDDETYKLVLDELLADAGVDVMFHAALFDVETEGGRVTSVLLAHNGGPIRVTGKVFIDATGDALLADRAGAQIEIGDEDGNVMPMTLFFALADVDTANMPSHEQMLTLCAAGGADSPPLENTNFSCLCIAPNGLVYINAIRVGGDTLAPFDISRAEAEGRRRVENFVTWLKANIPAYKNCRLVKTAPHIGIRESRRVIGDYVLTSDDFFNATKFDDAIACSCYPIDVHGQNQGEVNFTHLPPGEHFHIPWRCLTPKGFANLLMASRSISADVLAHSSIRVMPIVMNIGEAAGIAAAMSLPQGDVREVDIQSLQQRIRAAGGVLEPQPLEPS